MPAHTTLYVRRKLYSQINGFDTSYRIAADYLSILQLFSLNDFKAIYISEVLVKMRVGGASNKSLRAIFKKTIEDWRALRACKHTVTSSIKALMYKNFSKISQFILFK
jgi:glycosyltransferase